MAERVVFLNGEFVPESKASVSVFDRSFMSGDLVRRAALFRPRREDPIRAMLPPGYRVILFVSFLNQHCGRALNAKPEPDAGSSRRS